MEIPEKDGSIYEAVARRRKRSSALSELAKEQGVESTVLGRPKDLGSKAPDASASASNGSIDEDLIANLGSGKNDYGLLDELVPLIDFEAIPLTQPRRVLAKSRGEALDRNDLEIEEEPEVRTKNTRTKSKKKPASLLDSYFKGL